TTACASRSGGWKGSGSRASRWSSSTATSRTRPRSLSKIAVPMLADLLADLVRIDSINPALIEAAAGEGERPPRFGAGWLGAAGVEVGVEGGAPGRFNAVGIARGSGGGKTLLLNAHMDTV